MTNTPNRNCASCGTTITDAFGFVKAGDMLDSAGNLILDYSNRPLPRELCGGCAILWQWTSEGVLEPSPENTAPLTQ